MSKILILTGSPRKNGNTMKAVNAFSKAAQEKEHMIKQYDTTSMKVIGCRACGSCYKNGNACIFDEGFNEIASEIETADIILLAAPVYWYGFPAQIKAVIDKFFSLMAKLDQTGGKKCALISVCGDIEISAFDSVVNPYRAMCNFLNWESLGEVLIPGVMDINDIEKTDGINQSIALANKLV